jgi:hypothetical protein
MGVMTDPMLTELVPSAKGRLEKDSKATTSFALGVIPFGT